LHVTNIVAAMKSENVFASRQVCLRDTNASLLGAAAHMGDGEHVVRPTSDSRFN
jgi:hypothetical protein